MYDVVARNGASGTFRRIGDDATFAESRIARFGRAFALAGGAVAAAATLIGVESVRMATTFQAQMTRIQTQAGGSARDVHMLSDAVLRLSATHAEQGPQQLAAALYHLKSIGLDNVKAMRALRQASDLAAVGGASLEETTNALGGAWRSGIKGAHSFRQTVASVNSIIGAGNMTMEDFISSLSSGILPAARTFGVSLKSVGSALALMTDEGIPAEVAATRLRMTLTLLGAPTDKAKAALKTIGITQFELARDMRGPNGLVGAVADLKKHLVDSGVSGVKASDIIAKAFGGGRSSSAIQTLLNNLDVLQRKQDQINSTAGRFTSAVAAQRRTAGAQFSRLAAIVESAGVRIGLALLPPVTGFVSFIVNRAVPTIGRFAGSVETAFKRIVPVEQIKHDWQSVLRFFGVAAPPKPRIAPSASDMSAALRGAALPNIASTRDVQAATVIHPVLRVAPVSSGISDALSKIDWGRVTARLGPALGAALGNALGWIGQHAAVFTAGLVKALAGIDWVSVGKVVGGNAIGFAIGFISNLGADLFSGSFWEHHWWDLILAAVSVFGVGKFGGLIARLLEHIPVLRMFAPLFRGLESITKPVTKLAGTVGGAVWRGVMTGLRDIFPRGMAFLDREFGLLGTRIGVAAITVLDKARSVGGGLVNGIERGAAGLTRLIGRLIVNITRPFAGAGKWLVDEGASVVRGLLSGITSIARGLFGWVQTHVAKPILNAILGFFHISSPSKVMMGVGSHIMSGLFAGIMKNNPLDMVKRVFGSLPKALGSLVEHGFVSISKLPSRLLGMLGKLGGAVGRALIGMLTKLTGGSSAAPVALQRAALAMFGRYGWGASQMAPLISLWNQESGWRWNALNPSSGAYGIPQSLPASKMASAGADWRTNPITQIAWGLSYIAQRYGSPAGAWAHEVSHNWYAKGTAAARAGWAWVGERGPELIHLAGGETILPAGLSSMIGQGISTGFAKGTGIGGILSGLGIGTSSLWSDIHQFLKDIRDHFNGPEQRRLTRLVMRQADDMADVRRQFHRVQQRVSSASAYAGQVMQGLAGTGDLSNLTLGGAMIGTKRLSSGAYLATQLGGQLASLKKFSAALRRLTSMHAPGSIIRQIVAMGPVDGLDYANAILAGGPKLIRQLGGLESQISAEEKRIGRGAATAVYTGRYITGHAVARAFDSQEAHLRRLFGRLGNELGREAARWLRGGRHHRFARGGIISEPVFGIGQFSGDSYLLGEAGRERVGPVNGPLTRGALVNIEGDMVVQDATDVAKVAQQLAFRTYAATLGA